MRSSPARADSAVAGVAELEPPAGCRSPAQDQIRALPSEVVGLLAEAMSVLSLVSWNRAPLHKDNPEGNVRVLPSAGAGRVTHLILEDQRRMHLLQCSGSLSPRQRSTRCTMPASPDLMRVNVWRWLDERSQPAGVGRRLARQCCGDPKRMKARTLLDSR
jgi:hypothetical protein